MEIEKAQAGNGQECWIDRVETDNVWKKSQAKQKKRGKSEDDGFFEFLILRMIP